VSIPISLVASAPLLVITALFYIVGIVGYYAGRENAPTTALDETDESDSGQPSSTWSFAVGISAFLAALAVQYLAGITGNSNIALGVILPFTISVVVGFVAGIAIYLLTAYLD
jgi:hypothetical protein